MPLLLIIGAVAAAAALLRLAYGAGYLNVDAMWSLQWGEDLLAAQALTPSNGTTPHPLSNLVGALASLAGRDADLLLIAASYVGAGVLVIATGVIAARLAGSAAGVAGAAIIATRPELLASTTAGMLDVWAAALTCLAVAMAIPGKDGAPSRPTAVALLLLAAGLLRPEAWALALVWWAWRAWTAHTLLPRELALALAAPVLWMLMDLVFTGDALFAIHQTDAAAGALRQIQGIATGLGADLERTLRGIGGALRPPLLVALLVAGGVYALLVVRDRADASVGSDAVSGPGVDDDRATSRRAFGLVWATLVLYVALLLLQAASGTLMFSRFALVVAALGAALVAATAVRAAPRAWPAAAVAGALSLLVVLPSVGALADARRAAEFRQGLYADARAALRPGVPCAPLATTRNGVSIYASRWTGLELDQILESQTGPLDRPASYVDVDTDPSSYFLRDPRTIAPIGAPGAGAVRTTPGWQVTATCR